MGLGLRLGLGLVGGWGRGRIRGRIRIRSRCLRSLLTLIERASCARWSERKPARRCLMMSIAAASCSEYLSWSGLGSRVGVRGCWGWD